MSLLVAAGVLLDGGSAWRALVLWMSRCAMWWSMSTAGDGCRPTLQENRAASAQLVTGKADV
jgi:hypothetical protein